MLAGLADRGYGEAELTEIRRLIDAEHSDLYDVLSYIAYAIKPISRQERVMTHRDLIFARYTGNQKAFLEFVLAQYVKAGVGELDRQKLPQLLQLKYHEIHDAVKALGGIAEISDVFVGFQQYLYWQDAA